MNTPLSLARVGQTEVQVSRMGLGTVPLGGFYRSISQQEVERVVHTAFEQGIRWIDTAPLYGAHPGDYRDAGLCECNLGAALAGVPRTRFVISTKVGRCFTTDHQLYFDYSRDAILRSLEESLQRLRLDSVDILMIHDADNHYQQALDEGFPTLVELRRQGIVKAIGAGMNQWQMLARFAREVDVDCLLVAGRYTLLEQTTLEEFLPLCQQRGISVFLGGVFNSGILSRGARPGAPYNYKAAPADILERAERIERVCQQFQVPLYAAALQFVLAHPAVTAIAVGAETPEEVVSNRQALEMAIPEALWRTLKDAGLLAREAPTPTPV